MENLAQFESDLWEAADNLRANSKLTSSDYFMPVLGVSRFGHALEIIGHAEQGQGVWLKAAERKSLVYKGWNYFAGLV